MTEQKKDDFDKALIRVNIWIKAITNYPGFSEWKSKSLRSTLNHGDSWIKALEEDHSKEFIFPPHIEKQHSAIMAFFALHTTWQALANTEFYFRRYPFSNLPVSLDAHLRYTCEAYFSRVYEFRERLKKCLNAINEVIPYKVDAGALIKAFSKDFHDEIKARNLIHHHNCFDEVMIDRIMLEGLMALDIGEGRGDRGWKQEQRQTYRKASRQWANRVKRRSARVREYLNAVSRLVVEECIFLSEPITTTPD